MRASFQREMMAAKRIAPSSHPLRRFRNPAVSNPILSAAIILALLALLALASCALHVEHEADVNFFRAPKPLGQCDCSTDCLQPDVTRP